MKKISWKGLLSAFLLVAGILQLFGGTLFLIRFQIAKPQNFILGIAFLIFAFVLHKSPTIEKKELRKPNLTHKLRCPKCGKAYDSSWTVCLQCRENLIPM